MLIDELQQAVLEFEAVYGKPKKIVMSQLTYNVFITQINFTISTSTYGNLDGIPIEIDNTAPYRNIYLKDIVHQSKLNYEASF
jgi:hypothetical protein